MGPTCQVHLVLFEKEIMYFGGGEEEYGRKIFEEKKIEEEKKNREGKGTKQFVRNRQQKQNKSRTKKSRTLLYILPTLIRN